jgi:chitinase
MHINIIFFLALTILSFADTHASLSSYKYVAYYPSWVSQSNIFTPDKIDASKFTHLNYAFIGLSDTGQLTFTDAQEKLRAEENFKQFVYLKKTYSHLKTLLSIGGGTPYAARNFSKMASSHQTRKAFAESCLAFCIKYNFDGIDLDWEYPTSVIDKNNFTALVTTLAATCRKSQPDFLITFAGPVNYKKLENFDFAAIDPHINWINVMAYDFHGPWPSATVTNHLAPLYAGTMGTPQFCIEFAINCYVKQNIKTEKIILGIPLYARTFSDAKETATGLFSKYSGRGSGIIPGVWRLSHISPIISKTHTLYWDNIAQAAYYYNAQTGDFISCENEQSLTLKADYIKNHKLGGAMFWALYDKDVIEHAHLLCNKLGS